MPRPDETPIAVDDHGSQTHPSFGVVRVVSVSGGTQLFDSSIPHHRWIKLEISRASRRRNLHTDYIHADNRALIEIDMSMAQWAQLVSSIGDGSGTPVTINRFDGEMVPRAADDTSRLAKTAEEVAGAAAKATAKMLEAVDTVREAFDAKAGRREMAAAIDILSRAVSGVPATMKYAADSLTRHSEEVVIKAAADIEAATRRAMATTTAAEPKEIT